MSVHVSVDVLSEGAAYLWDPPSNSWVSSVASLFFILGLLVASPIFLLLALDFTSYAIVRTLGIENAHPVSSKATLSIITTTGTSPSSSSTPSPVNEKATKGTSTSISLKPSSAATTATARTGTSKRPKNISIPHPQSLTMDQVQPFFTTPGGANLELEGLFSPPESRTPSPPGTTTTTSSSFVHLDHQGGNNGMAQPTATSDRDQEEGQTPRLEVTPASGTGKERSTRNDALGVASSSSSFTGDKDASTDALGLLRRRKPVPEQN